MDCLAVSICGPNIGITVDRWNILDKRVLPSHTHARIHTSTDNDLNSFFSNRPKTKCVKLYCWHLVVAFTSERVEAEKVEGTATVKL